MDNQQDSYKFCTELLYKSNGNLLRDPSSHHFCVVYADNAQQAYLVVERTLANLSSNGQKAMEYEIKNSLPLDSDNSDDVYISDIKITEIKEVYEYIWKKVLVVDWDIKFFGDVAFTKKENGHEMSENDWLLIEKYAREYRNKWRYMKKKEFDLSSNSIFSEEFDYDGVTHIIDHDRQMLHQYVVVVENFSLF